MNGNRLLTDSFCAFKPIGERVCNHNTERGQACENRTSCFCVVENAGDNCCITSADLVDGEMCVHVLDSTASRPSFSVLTHLRGSARRFRSTRRTQPVGTVEHVCNRRGGAPPLGGAGLLNRGIIFSRGFGRNEICAKARALAKVPQGDLFFRLDILACGLCNLDEHCATVDHIAERGMFLCACGDNTSGIPPVVAA